MRLATEDIKVAGEKDSKARENNSKNTTACPHPYPQKYGPGVETCCSHIILTDPVFW
jgi:hypothetical protein